MNTFAAKESASHAMSLPEVEKLLTAIWEKCLKREAIGANDNFFDLGGNSISAMYIATMVNEALSVDIPFQRVMELDDIESMAQFLFRHAQGAGGAEVGKATP